MWLESGIPDLSAEGLSEFHIPDLIDPVPEPVLALKADAHDVVVAEDHPVDPAFLRKARTSFRPSLPDTSFPLFIDTFMQIIDLRARIKCNLHKMGVK